MSDMDDGGWGDNTWLTDRDIRQRWMRMTALSSLAEQILRTPARAELAIACVLDEVFGKAAPLRPATIDRCVETDTDHVTAWLKRAATRASRHRERWSTVAVVLNDGPPYELDLALAGASPQIDDWADTITLRGTEQLPLTLPSTLLPRTKRMTAAVRRQADYIVPLAYAAFVVRDTLRDVAPFARRASAAVVCYAGGDQLVVPLAR